MRRLIDRYLGRPGVVLFAFVASMLAGWRGFDVGWAAISRTAFHWRFSVFLRTTQYFFCYQDFGFIKRGLVGTILHPFPAVLTRVGLAALSWGLLLAFAVQFWRFLVDSTETVAANGRGVLAFLCATMPAFFIRLGWDFGRFDVFDLMAGILALELGLRRRWFWASFPAAAAVLIHEDFLFFGLPLVGALAWSAPDGSPVRPRLSALKALALPLLAAAAVGLFGRSALSTPQLVAKFSANPAYLAALPDGVVQTNEITVLNRTLRDNFLFNRRMFVEKKAVLHLPMILAWFAFAVGYASAFYRRNGWGRDLLFYAAFGPLLIGIVGFDYYRWFAMAAVNLIIVLLLKCRLAAAEGRTPVVVWDLNAKVLAASALLGPISNTKSFPYFFLLLEKLSPWRFSW